MSDFPHLKRRNALFPTEAGERVNLSALHQSFTRWESCAWNCYTLPIAYDEFGTLPGGVEAFLRELNQSVSELDISPPHPQRQEPE